MLGDKASSVSTGKIENQNYEATGCCQPQEAGLILSLKPFKILYWNVAG